MNHSKCRLRQPGRRYQSVIILLTATLMTIHLTSISSFGDAIDDKNQRAPRTYKRTHVYTCCLSDKGLNEKLCTSCSANDELTIFSPDARSTIVEVKLTTQRGKQCKARIPFLMQGKDLIHSYRVNDVACKITISSKDSGKVIVFPSQDTCMMKYCDAGFSKDPYSFKAQY